MGEMWRYQLGMRLGSLSLLRAVGHGHGTLKTNVCAMICASRDFCRVFIQFMCTALGLEPEQQINAFERGEQLDCPGAFSTQLVPCVILHFTAVEQGDFAPRNEQG